jgi:hypothetical protein
MRAIQLLMLVLLPALVFPARAADDADDLKFIGGVLSMVQQLVHLAAQSSDPKAVDKEVDAMLSGQSAQANRLAAGMMEEILRDVPLEQRSAFVSIGRDLVTIARRERARAGSEQAPQSQSAPAPAIADLSAEAALRARRELHAMGLRYWDEQQYAEAVKRGDRIAVELYLAAQGLPAAAVTRNPPPAR